MHFFDAGPDDLEAIMRVMATAFDPRFGEAWTQGQMRTLFGLPGTRLCAVTLHGTVAGFYAARIAGPESELLLLAVDPAARRQSIGSNLLNHWQNWAKSAGANEYFLEMRADNPARSLYERFGFVECGRRFNYYTGQDGVLRDAVTMRHIDSATV